MTEPTKAEVVCGAVCAAANRVMDELSTIILGSIALLLVLHRDGATPDSLRHDAVLAVVSGLLGYMKNRPSSSATKVTTPDGFAATMTAGAQAATPAPVEPAPAP